MFEKIFGMGMADGVNLFIIDVFSLLLRVSHKCLRCEFKSSSCSLGLQAYVDFPWTLPGFCPP